jgi:anhydro-N-acetylmuramic acid kinase
LSDLYIGLISGTSMDAIDAVLLEIGNKGCHLRATHSHPISRETLSDLRSIVDHPDHVSLDRLGQLDTRLGRDFAAAAGALLAASGMDRGNIRAIGSHGQTVFHAPGGRVPFTMQIGDPNIIASETGITTVADFRRRDVALGGQGAPLVPAFHQAIFGSSDEPRSACNIGGIANLTVMVPGQPTSGFDTGPGNTLMDAWTRLKRGHPHDTNGQWAASSEPDEGLLARLLDYEYFSRSAPKSTGVEEFNLGWLQKRLDKVRDPLSAGTVQSTLCQLTAATIAGSLTRVCPEPGGLYLCGGGAHNATLRDRIAVRLPGWRIETTESLGIGVDWVEAAAFAWLASRTIAGLPGNIPEVTGATSATILGAIYPA